MGWVRWEAERKALVLYSPGAFGSSRFHMVPSEGKGEKGREPRWGLEEHQHLTRNL